MKGTPAIANSYWTEFGERWHAEAVERALAEHEAHSKKNKEAGKAMGEIVTAGVKAYKAYQANQVPAYRGGYD